LLQKKKMQSKGPLFGGNGQEGIHNRQDRYCPQRRRGRLLLPRGKVVAIGVYNAPGGEGIPFKGGRCSQDSVGGKKNTSLLSPHNAGTEGVLLKEGKPLLKTEHHKGEKWWTRGG